MVTTHRVTGPACCSSCGAPIIWAKTARLRRFIPLDKEPIIGGNIVLDGGIASIETIGLFDRTPKYVSHFTTCPNAKKHRRPRR